MDVKVIGLGGRIDPSSHRYGQHAVETIATWKLMAPPDGLPSNLR